MRRPDNWGLWGHETVGQKGGAGMMGHLAVHRAGADNPEGSGRVPIVSGVRSTCICTSAKLLTVVIFTSGHYLLSNEFLRKNVL